VVIHTTRASKAAKVEVTVMTKASKAAKVEVTATTRARATTRHDIEHRLVVFKIGFTLSMKAR